MVSILSSDEINFNEKRGIGESEPDFRMLVVGSPHQDGVSTSTHTKDKKNLQLVFVSGSRFNEYLEHFEEGAPLAAVFLLSETREAALSLVSVLRKRHKFYRTRVYIVSFAFGEQDFFGHSIDHDDALDIEQVIASSSSNFTNKLSETQRLENAIHAYISIQSNPLMPDYYLDTTYDKLFDWFETTRWDWSDLGDFSNIQKELITDEEIEILKESAIIEFGTLPGAHNFLREWEDEYSFSSWALSWGAEEARHSLVQCRYLRTLGINIRAKHAMYKRQPYPVGENQSGTLMMNIVSESRAAEYYRRLSNQTREPSLQKIWKLLGQDEARHARAFFIFCKELCQTNEKHLFEALKMAYVWLADRENGVKHPAGLFFPHSTSTDGLRRIEGAKEAMTDKSDARVLAMCGELVGTNSVKSTKDLKNIMREFA